MDKMKPCPFCGENGAHAEITEQGGSVWGVHCPNGQCPTAGCWVVKDFSEAEAIAAWNTRPTGEIAALREALKPFAERETTEEALTSDKPPEWVGLSPEQRVEMIGERVRQDTENILRARTALKDTSHGA